jgi:hypothetical protein
MMQTDALTLPSTAFADTFSTVDLLPRLLKAQDRAPAGLLHPNSCVEAFWWLHGRSSCCCIV